ncbi:IS3 family transposase [Variovorax sp. GB1R11]|uniref:IS3 family transposase n=1 Tax=Variovorax sp. GB1R11 TaxID=3443741 RepID=UPI003F4692FA
MGEDLGDARLAELIGSIQDEVPGYGYRRVTHELRRRGHVVNQKRGARVMRAQGVSIKLRSALKSGIGKVGTLVDCVNAALRSSARHLCSSSGKPHSNG